MSKKTDKTVAETVLFCLAVAIIVLLCIAMVHGSWGRTFVIEARTFGATVALRGDVNNWELEEVVLCRARALPDLKAVDGPFCPAVIFEETEAGPRVVAWPSGATIALRYKLDGSMVIEVLSGAEPEFKRGDRLIVPGHIWSRHPALSINGAIVFGSDIGSGSNDYLLSGHWEARQSSFAASWFRATLELVRQGEFSRGATAEVWTSPRFFGLGKSSRPANMFGHITPSFDQDEPGLILSAISETTSLEMHLRYYGVSQKSVVRPDILDTILTSPVILAAAALLGILSLMIELGKNIPMNREIYARALGFFRRLWPRGR
ncbi:hypothetical protein [Salipiger mangrovisoli]|uniref:MacB-like periplasmic core domain-containing protein n=1 Tax=Salipiger mangrovisoli TaxID=2865933 RepID=A0ABR9WYI4_9RHOB|nr:hypothetical protein [Salipiger mangrovisoli]MBE9636311.1 hypothetical protein [Salipiger mangrovisoli]